MTPVVARSKQTSSSSHLKGFSLVEISVVIIIIALLIAGVLMGRNLISSSELKDAMVDMDYYSTAVKSFQDKYNALPGDFSGATAVWGAADPTPSTCWTTFTTSKVTCNGDGNGRWDSSYEFYSIWKHLANAGFIKGNFLGTTDNIGPGATPRNLAKGTMDGLYISAWYRDLNPGSDFFNGSYGNFFMWGTSDKLPPSATYRADYPILSTEASQELDNKMDDGKPGTGIVRSQTQGNSRTPNCATTTDPNTAAYNLSTQGRACALIYIPGF